MGLSGVDGHGVGVGHEVALDQREGILRDAGALREQPRAGELPALPEAGLERVDRQVQARTVGRPHAKRVLGGMGHAEIGVVLEAGSELV
jgi:hypothetical protein